MLGIESIYWSGDTYRGYDIHVLRHNSPKDVCWASRLSGLRILENIVNPNYLEGSQIPGQQNEENVVGYNLSDLIYYNINSIPPLFASTTTFLGISFEVSFTGDGTDPDYYTRDNVKVHKVTGDIRATKYPLPQTGKLKNFILTVRINLTTTKSITKAMRVHVHEGISKVWLTPDTLTLPVGEDYSSFFGTSPKKFSVFAEFEEGEGENTIADITYHPEVNWVLTAGSGSVTIYESTGHITVSPTDIGLSGLKKATVELATTINNHLATLPEGSTSPILEGNLVFSGTPNISPGTIEVTQSFIEPPNLQPNIVKFMGRGPGRKKRNEVRNILIIGEGYLDSENNNFTEHTNHMITGLTNRGKSRPWDILAGTFNTWRAFKPSRQTGISILNEVIIVKDRRPKESTSTPRAMAIEEFIGYADEYLLGGGKYRYASGDIPLDVSGATQGQARSTTVNENAGEFGLRKLVEKVGYPVPKDTEFSGTYYSDKLAEWTTIFGSGITVSTVANDTIDLWRNLGERTLINERDTYWSLACGSKPRYEDEEPARSIAFNPRGMTRFDMRNYLSTLKPSILSSVIGAELWGITKVETTESGATVPTITYVDGKDQDLVVYTHTEFVFFSFQGRV